MRAATIETGRKSLSGTSCCANRRIASPTPRFAAANTSSSTGRSAVR